jgi:hypothetical protein
MNTRAYEVIFQRSGHDVEALIWQGSRSETRALARRVAGNGVYRIVDLDAAGDLLRLRLALQLGALRQTIAEIERLEAEL